MPLDQISFIASKKMKASKKMGFLNPIFLIIFQILINQFVSAKDVLSPGDELNSTSTLVSAGGNFTLGFFTIPTTKFTYLGIWYTNDLMARKVWVANRNIPMISNGVLMIDESGTLKVIRGGGNNTTMFNVSDQFGSGVNTRAVLEDSGNFVLYEVTENRTLWQSFDHPTDTLLPGMKLGYNLTTKQNWTLTSWFSEEDPASGDFTMSLEQIQNSNSAQAIIYQRGNVYWSSGPWENRKFQVSMRQFDTPFQQNLSLIAETSGMYFTFQTINSSTLSMLKLSWGNLLDGTSTPTLCYGDESCEYSYLPTCNRGKTDSFQKRRGYWTGDGFTVTMEGLNFNYCMEICWNQCNCKGFSTFYVNETGCKIWGGSEKTFNADELRSEVIYVLVSQQLPKTKFHHAEKKWIWVLCVASVLTSALVALFCYVRIRKRRQNNTNLAT